MHAEGMHAVHIVVLWFLPSSRMVPLRWLACLIALVATGGAVAAAASCTTGADCEWLGTCEAGGLA